MAYVQKTLSAAATTGYVVELGQKCGKVSVQTVGRAAFKIGKGTVPSTPTNAYFPGAGATTDTIELAAGGEFQYGSDPAGAGYDSQKNDPIEWVAVWAHDGGLVRILGH